MAAASPKEKFDAAVKVIHSLPKDGPFQPSREMMLTFYGYYKQATEGQCKLPKPSFWDVVKKAKWEAWNKLGDMKREHAMDKYVEELKKTLKSGANQWNEMESKGDPRIVEAMPQTQVVGDFMDKLGAFYEVVDEESPIEQARTARSAKSLPPDHNYNLQPIDHLQNSALAEFDTRDDDLNDPGAGEGDSGVSLTQNGHSPTPPRDISSSDSEEEFCDTSTDLEFPLERREVLHNGPVPSTISTHVKTSRVRFADVNDNHSSSSNGHSHESFTVPQGFPYISPRPGTQDDSLIVQTSSPVTSNFKDLNGDLEVSPSDLDIGREVVIDRLSPVGPGVAPQGQREENEPPNGGNGDKGKDNDRSKSGQGATPKRSGSQGLPSAGGGGRRLLLAGGGGGGGDQTGGEGSGDPVGEQISLTLARLQQDMAQVLDRLNRLEAQSRQGQGPDKTNGSIFSWFRPSGTAGQMAFFFLVWPVIVHLLLTYFARRRRRR